MNGISSQANHYRPGREWRAIARARTHTHHISLRRANIANANFIKDGFRRAIIALASLKEGQIARVEKLERL